MRWNTKRLIGLLITLIIYAVGIWLLTFQEWPLGYYGTVWFLGLTAFVAIIFAWRPYRILTIILCVCLITAQAPAKPPPEKKVVSVACVVAVAIIGVGIVIILGLKKLCDKCLPPRDTTTQPPPPPTSTNHPPHLLSLPAGAITINLSDDNVTYYDVSTNHLDYSDPNGYPYTLWFTYQLESSTNMSDWKTEGTMNGWVSATTIATVFSNGTSSVTNFSPRSSSTIASPFEFVTADSDRKFFRVR